jgi:hypothetical protein
MRNLILSALAACAVVACGGPSSNEVTNAKQARYKGDPQTLLAAIKTTAEAKQYKIGKLDAQALTVETAGRWYQPTGTLASENDDMRQVPNNGLNLIFVVSLVPDGDAYFLKLHKRVLRNIAGRPNPDVLAEDDISIPGWVDGKKDKLAYDLHDALAQFQVAETGGVAPGPAPAPAPNPPNAPLPDPATPAPTGY